MRQRLPPKRIQRGTNEGLLNHDNPVKCPCCEEICKDGSQLRIHLRKMHTQFSGNT